MNIQIVFERIQMYSNVKAVFKCFRYIQMYFVVAISMNLAYPQASEVKEKAQSKYILSAMDFAVWFVDTSCYLSQSVSEGSRWKKMVRSQI